GGDGGPDRGFGSGAQVLRLLDLVDPAAHRYRERGLLLAGVIEANHDRDPFGHERILGGGTRDVLHGKAILPDLADAHSDVNGVRMEDRSPEPAAGRVED